MFDAFRPMRQTPWVEEKFWKHFPAPIGYFQFKCSNMVENAKFLEKNWFSFKIRLGFNVCKRLVFISFITFSLYNNYLMKRKQSFNISTVSGKRKFEVVPPELEMLFWCLALIFHQKIKKKWLLFSFLKSSIFVKEFLWENQIF